MERNGAASDETRPPGNLRNELDLFTKDEEKPIVDVDIDVNIDADIDVGSAYGSELGSDFGGNDGVDRYADEGLDEYAGELSICFEEVLKTLKEA